MGYDHMPSDRIALVESPYQYNEKLQNSLMSSPKGDPVWATVFDTLVIYRDAGVLQSTGPNFIDSVIERLQDKSVVHVLPCENFHRLPYHQHRNELSPFMSRFHRETVGRIFPMKYCGNFHELSCNFGLHHNSASYLPETGVSGLF